MGGPAGVGCGMRRVTQSLTKNNLACYRIQQWDLNGFSGSGSLTGVPQTLSEGASEI